MLLEGHELTVKTLGPCRLDSPLAALLETRRRPANYVDENDRVLFDDTAAMSRARGVPRRRAARLRAGGAATQDLLRPVEDARRHRHLRRAVPRAQRRHPRPGDGADASTTACTRIFGFRNGYQGFIARYGHDVDRPDARESCAASTRTAARCSARRAGSRTPSEIVDCLERLNINILFVIGGDGSMRGAHEDRRRGRRARREDRRRRHPEDDRQRHPVHRPELRLPDGVLDGDRVDPRGARRGHARRPTASAWSS